MCLCVCVLDGAHQGSDEPRVGGSRRTAVGSAGGAAVLVVGSGVRGYLFINGLESRMETGFSSAAGAVREWRGGPHATQSKCALH